MSKAPDIRLVAVDLDGTLLDSRKRVCPRAAEALGCLPRRGIQVVIASARPPRSVRQIYRCLKLDTLQINYNGALIWDEPNRAVAFHRPMPCGLVREMIADARGVFPQVLVSCEILDRWYTDRFDQTHTTETGRLFQPDVVAPVEAFCVEPVTKLMLLGPPAMMDAITARFAGRAEVGVIRSDPDLLQIADARATKAEGLRRVAAHYGVAMSDVLAIGDATNDVPMLEAAGLAVAVGNAHPAAKAAADWVAPSNDEAGVHSALVRFGLCG